MTAPLGLHFDLATATSNIAGMAEAVDAVKAQALEKPWRLGTLLGRACNLAALQHHAGMHVECATALRLAADAGEPCSAERAHPGRR